MVDHLKTVELGSITLTCMFEDSTGEKSCEIVQDDRNRKGVRLSMDEVHGVRSTAEEIWTELENKYGDDQ